MITIKEMREHVLTAAEKYDIPITIRQAETLTHHLAIHANSGTDRKARLTDVQMAALLGLACGESTEETAQRICRSTFTVKTHRRTLYQALGARSGAHAVAIAIAMGLLRVTPREVVSGGEAR